MWTLCCLLFFSACCSKIFRPYLMACDCVQYNLITYKLLVSNPIANKLNCGEWFVFNSITHKRAAIADTSMERANATVTDLPRRDGGASQWSRVCQEGRGGYRCLHKNHTSLRFASSKKFTRAKLSSHNLKIH